MDASDKVCNISKGIADTSDNECSVVDERSDNHGDENDDDSDSTNESDNAESDTDVNKSNLQLQQVSVKDLSAFLSKYMKLWEEIEEIECGYAGDLIVCSDSPSRAMELLDASEDRGWDFSKYNVHVMFDGGSGDYFSGIVHIPGTEDNVDRCPIHVFDLGDATSAPRFVGNFRTYIDKVLTWYLEQEDIGRKKLARRALEHLKSVFSEECVMPATSLSLSDFNVDAGDH